jgi:hypothetical protein
MSWLIKGGRFALSHICQLQADMGTRIRGWERKHKVLRHFAPQDDKQKANTDPSVADATSG